MVYLASYSQQKLFDELVRSFGLAFLLVTPIMMIVLRSFTAGLLAMIPNVAPTLCLFGAMGWSSQPLSIGTILTATVGLGIAVDDTLHFLCWYRTEQGSDRFSPISSTVIKCFRPMIQTSMICGISLLMFYPAEFVPVHQFAVSIAILLGLALVFDLIYLPMLLASPLGTVFRARARSAPGAGYSPTGKSLSASHRV